MTTPALSASGLTTKTIADVLEQINADQAASPAFDPSINTSPGSVQGEANAIIADTAGQLWSALRIAYSAGDPDASEDFALENIALLTGTFRQPATPSSFTNTNNVWVGLAPNTTIDAGATFSQLGNPSNQYVVNEGVSSSLGAADKSTILSVVSGLFTTPTKHKLLDGTPVTFATTGDFPTPTDPNKPIANDVYFVRDSGNTPTNKSSTFFKVAKTAGGIAIDANGGTGVSVFPAYAIPSARCTTPGPIACDPLTLTLIATPITGLYIVTNPSAAFLGGAGDDNPALEARRVSELRARGSGTLPAMQASIRDIEFNGFQPVVDVVVTENTLDVFDFAKVLPPHSFRVLVNDFLDAGGAPVVPNDIIAQTIWNNRPPGIPAVGTSSGNAIDDEGQTHVVFFSRPSQLEVHVAVSLVVDPSVYDASNAPAQTAVVDAFTANVRAGEVVRFSWLVSALGSVAGVVAVESVNIEGAGANVDFQLSKFALGWMQTSDVTVSTSTI